MTHNVFRFVRHGFWDAKPWDLFVALPKDGALTQYSAFILDCAAQEIDTVRDKKTKHSRCK